MYGHIKGEDDHFCFAWKSKRKECENWLEEQLVLYEICYTNAEVGIMSNKDFKLKFPEEMKHDSVSWRRIGNKLRERVEEVRMLRNAK